MKRTMEDLDDALPAIPRVRAGIHRDVLERQLAQAFFQGPKAISRPRGILPARWAMAAAVAALAAGGVFLWTAGLDNHRKEGPVVSALPPAPMQTPSAPAQARPDDPAPQWLPLPLPAVALIIEYDADGVSVRLAPTSETLAAERAVGATGEELGRISPVIITEFLLTGPVFTRL